jgi:AcrR family transcriptional regulator
MTHDTSNGALRRPRADAERNRAHIVSVAMQLLARNPDCTFEEIVMGSGLGRTTVFRHFRTRDELIEAVVGVAVGEFNRLLDEAQLDTGPAVDALKRLISSTAELANRLPILLADSMPAVEAIADAQLHAPLARLALLFERGQETGEFRTDVSSGWMVEAMKAIMDAAFRRIGRGHSSIEELNALVIPFVIGGTIAR